MPRLTPEELKAAKRRRAEERVAEERRISEEREMAAKRDAERKAWLAEAKEGHKQLASAVESLYTEVDKLAKKWPTMPVSQLTLDRTNKAIRAVRKLLETEANDFATDINEIVAAGDLPEHRDVLLILGELRAALQRFKEKYQSEWGYS